MGTCRWIRPWPADWATTPGRSSKSRSPDLAGSLGGGGRYDDLVGMFLGQRVPACGLSLGLERILVVMGERGMFPPSVERPPADVLVANFEAGAVAEALPWRRRSEPAPTG